MLPMSHDVWEVMGFYSLGYSHVDVDHVVGCVRMTTRIKSSIKKKTSEVVFNSEFKSKCPPFWPSLVQLYPNVDRFWAVLRRALAITCYMFVRWVVRRLTSRRYISEINCDFANFLFFVTFLLDFSCSQSPNTHTNTHTHTQTHTTRSA